MKKIITFIFFVIISIKNIYAFEAKPFYLFEFGSFLEPMPNSNINVGYVNLDLGYRFSFWKIQYEIYGGIENYHVWGGSGFDRIGKQYPFRINYEIGNVLWIEKKIGIKFEHVCSHPVISNYLLEKNYNKEKWYSNLGDRGTNSTFSIIIKN